MRHPVRTIRIDGELLPFDRVATLEVVEEPPDFRLDFWTLAGARVPAGRVEVETVDARTFSGYGMEAEPNPWVHVVVSAGGPSGWASGDFAPS